MQMTHQGVCCADPALCGLPDWLPGVNALSSQPPVVGSFSVSLRCRSHWTRHVLPGQPAADHTQHFPERFAPLAKALSGPHHRSPSSVDQSCLFPLAFIGIKFRLHILLPILPVTSSEESPLQQLVLRPV